MQHATMKQLQNDRLTGVRGDNVESKAGFLVKHSQHIYATQKLWNYPLPGINTYLGSISIAVSISIHNVDRFNFQIDKHTWHSK